MSKITAINLATSARLSATTTSAAGLDISDYTGNAKLILNSSVTEGAGMTSDVKITHCDTLNGTYVDAGIAFTQVTNVSSNGHQVIDFSIDGLSSFIKVVTTLAGTTPFVTRSVELVANKAY